MVVADYPCLRDKKISIYHLLCLYETASTSSLDIINKTKTKLSGKHFEWKDDDDDDDDNDDDDDDYDYD